MGKFVFENSSDGDVILQLEPWAQSWPVAPKVKVTFEFADDPIPAIDFSYEGPGHVLVSLMARDVVVTGYGGPPLRYGFDGNED